MTNPARKASELGGGRLCAAALLLAAGLPWAASCAGAPAARAGAEPVAASQPSSPAAAPAPAAESSAPEAAAPPPADPPAPLSYELLLGEAVPPGQAFRSQVFPDRYTDVDGVLTFRGGPLRTGGALGERAIRAQRLEVVWRFRTGPGGPAWGGGVGWTGEPVIIRWPDVIRHSMSALGPRRFGRGDGLVEVIQGSLDGNVYFLDLATGRPTRRPIRTGNPIKGSVSVDPRGWPLLFVGQGIPQSRPIGLRIFSLLDDRELYFLSGRDPLARRRWGAFDGCGLLNRKTDSFLLGGENGLVYLLELHSRFDPLALTLDVSPRVIRYRYRGARPLREGIESSIAVYRDLAFFGDNSGTIQALDLRTFKPVWAFEAGDDTDASLVVDPEPEGPAVYTACEVDHQGERGYSRIRKLSGSTGTLLWARQVSCRADHHSPHKVDGGAFATPLVGQDDLADRIIVTLSRCPAGALVMALAKSDGRELWRTALSTDAWSSPTAVRDAAAGKTWLLQADRGGLLHLIDGADGRIAFSLRLDDTVEASPALYGDMIVLGTRGGSIYGLRIR